MIEEMLLIWVLAMCWIEIRFERKRSKMYKDDGEHYFKAWLGLAKERIPKK